MAETTKQSGVGCPGAVAQAPVRKYNISNRQVTLKTAGQIPLGNRVNGFSLKNTGNTIVIFNREPIQPDESKTIGGNEGEEYIGRLDVTFGAQVLPPPPTPPPPPLNECWITIKYYV